MSEPNERDKTVAEDVMTCVYLDDFDHLRSNDDKAERIIAAYREEIEAQRAPAMPDDEALDRALEMAYDFKINDSTTNTRLSFDVWKEQTLAALRSRQGSTAADERPDFAPDIDPITGAPLFMWIEHPERGMVPTYGGPFDSYTLAERDEDECTPDEIHYFRERYDHDEGAWTDTIEGLRIVTITEDRLLELEEKAAARPSPQGEDTDQVEFLRKELALMTHKLITCGVAASHSDAALSSREKDYGGKWDSPQAQEVRALRQDRDALRARLDSAQSSAQAIAELLNVRGYLASADDVPRVAKLLAETTPKCEEARGMREALRKAGNAFEKIERMASDAGQTVIARVAYDNQIEARAALERNTKGIN